jgi:biotin carboxyl carrier protein|tara:strand:- start:846 stop:1229 length:384 start_codon:yes stop_codon:yes gene_type:complete
MENLTIKVDGKEYHVKIQETEDSRILIHCGGDVYEVESKNEAAIFETLKKKGTKTTGSGVIKSPLPGIIYSIKVKQGQKVKESQSLVTIIAMKMENSITSPKAGTVEEIKVKKNDNVKKGDILLVIS